MMLCFHGGASYWNRFAFGIGADDYHAMMEGHGLELFDEVSVTALGRKKSDTLSVPVCLSGKWRPHSFIGRGRRH